VPPRLRVLLAALLVHAGRVVPVTDLAEALWRPDHLATPEVTMRSYIKRLRQIMGPSGARIITRNPGYQIEVAEDELDLLRFSSLLRAGRTAVRTSAWQSASDLLNEGLGLWRGAPLADIASDVLQKNEVPRLEQLRLQALEWRIDADLSIGHLDALVPELQALTKDHPFREGFHGQLMLALCRCGRHAEALAAYQAARSVLVEELGAEPGPQLQWLHQRILAGDPALAWGTCGYTRHASAELRQAGAVVPRQLPAGVRHFAGRVAELAALDGLLAETNSPGGAVVISAIGGMAGVGKTALAVHWAHRVAERFPDGHLYVNLRGYDPGQPVAAGDALAGFLRALGVAGQDIPADADERAARYRSLLAGKRVLVVLDNAAGAEQVRLLLPGTRPAVAVVTSRDSLTGLVARDGVRRLSLGLLPPADAVGLLRTLIGERADADPGAAAALAARCSRLPLALRVAAELAAGRPAVPLADLVSELAAQQRRLDLLDAGGDPRTALRAVFSWSYRHLNPDAARAFRLMALHPGPDLDLYAAAALTGTAVERAGQLLDALARAHLIEPAGPGRHAMLDLLRAYARELAAAQDTEQEQRAALTRLLGHYEHTAGAAMNVLFPAEQHNRPPVPAAATPAPALADPAGARARLDAERASLIAVAVHAAERGWPQYATRLATCLYRYLHAGGYYTEAAALHEHARDAARHTGDRAAEARELTSLATIAMRQGRCQQATGHLQQALDLFRETRDLVGQARALSILGLIDLEQGRWPQAVGHFAQALTFFQQASDHTGTACALGNIGFAAEQQGRHRQARSYLRQALALSRKTGDRNSEGYALNHLGLVDAHLGRYQQAISRLQRAAALFQEIGSADGQAEALVTLGLVDLAQGRHEQAAGRCQQALTVCQQASDRFGEIRALNSLGEVLLTTGQPSRARTQHAAALALAGQLDSPYQQARAHHGLARAYHAIGDPGHARRHWRKALTIYTDLGAPEADQVGAQLSAGSARPLG